MAALTQSSAVRKSRGLRRLVDPDEPWVWLLYLPFYALPWFMAWGRGREYEGSGELVGSGIALGLFLVIYVTGSTAQGTRLIVSATAVFLLSIAVVPLGGNWSILTVYAGAMIGKLRPSKTAIGIILMFCAVASGVGAMGGLPVIWWFPGVVLTAMIGGATVSRVALGDKNLELEGAQEEVRTLSQIAERERITRDLHDLFGRTLTLIAVKADLAGRLLGTNEEAARHEIAEIGASARGGLQDVRQTLSGLGQPELAREIHASCQVLEAASVRCRVSGRADDVPRKEGAVLAMALREAVTNVVRHAGAKTCRIELERMRGRVELRVVDDGQGGIFREGSGIAGMRARLYAAGGVLTVEPGVRGMRLVATLPVGDA